MHAWWGALAGIGLIAVAYLGDQTVGARSTKRMCGAVMLVLGGYFTLVPGLSFAFLVNTEISLPPFTFEAYQSVVFADPALNRVEYRIDGSCLACWGWLEGDCQQIQR